MNRVQISRSFRASWFAAAAIAASATGGGTALSDAVAGLQPGQWVQLSTTGFNQALLGDSGGHHILQYTEDLIWDPGSKQLLFVGGGHGGDAAFIVYSEASNAWQERSLGGGIWSTNFSHAYDHSAIIPSTGRLYHRQPGAGDRLEIYNIAANTWTRSAVIPSGLQCCGALEWFPEYGRIVFVDGDNGVFAYEPAGNQWATLNASISGLFSYNNFAEYSPVHKVLIYGGGNGSNAVYRMNSSGQATRMQNAPRTLGTTHSVVTTDPISGNFIVMTSGDTYEYQPLTDTWSRLGGTAPPIAYGSDGVFGAVATPVSTHGVIAVAKYNGDTSRVYLYKHAPGSGVTQPSVSLQTSPTTIAVQGSTTLTWSSTNANACTAIGVPWAGAKATSGSETVGPIAATTAYTLTCTSTQGGSAGASVTVTVQSGTPAPTANLTANPTTVPANGASTLSWSSANATSCTASGAWTGTKATSGSESRGSIAANSTFTLRCQGAGGTSAPSSATVTVTGSTPAPTLTFTADPASVAIGARSTLQWSSSGASGCAASGAWAGNKAASGSEQTVALTTTSDFQLDCTGAGGSVSRTVTVAVSGGTTAPPGSQSGGGAIDRSLLAALALLWLASSGQALRRRYTLGRRE